MKEAEEDGGNKRTVNKSLRRGLATSPGRIGRIAPVLACTIADRGLSVAATSSRRVAHQDELDVSHGLPIDPANVVSRGALLSFVIFAAGHYSLHVAPSSPVAEMFSAMDVECEVGS